MSELRFRLGLDLDMNEQPLFLAIESADLDQFVHGAAALFVFRAGADLNRVLAQSTG